MRKSPIRFHIVTLFPHLCEGYLSDSILARAQKAKQIKVDMYNPRDFSKNKHMKVDHKPYGGGPGMVMSVEPIARALSHIKKKIARRKVSKTKIIMFTPGGDQFTNVLAKKWVDQYTDIIFICGRYEGVDARVRKIFRTAEISVGPYVLTGGELPALIVIDAMSRQAPGVLGNTDSREEERISSHEMYTRPEIFTFGKKEYKVPPVLLSGDHKKIDEWRQVR